MSLTFYTGDAGPITATISDDLGNPMTPLSATATIVNLHTGQVVEAAASCTVGEGFASWILTPGHDVSQTSARYVAYITVELDASTINTVSVPFDVLDKQSYFAVDRWRRKVEFSAPDEDSISDQEARDWIDQAVDFLGRGYGFEYTSTLAALDPAPSRQTVEYVAEVASLMARTAWWAGKGNWRDEEMSFDGTPFENEWKRLETKLSDVGISDWLVGDMPPKKFDMYNRDKANQWGIQDEPDDYFDAVWERDVQNTL